MTPGHMPSVSVSVIAQAEVAQERQRLEKFIDREVNARVVLIDRKPMQVMFTLDPKPGDGEKIKPAESPAERELREELARVRKIVYDLARNHPTNRDYKAVAVKVGVEARLLALPTDPSAVPPEVAEERRARILAERRKKIATEQSTKKAEIEKKHFEETVPGDTEADKVEYMARKLHDWGSPTTSRRYSTVLKKYTKAAETALKPERVQAWLDHPNDALERAAMLDLKTEGQSLVAIVESLVVDHHAYYDGGKA